MPAMIALVGYMPINLLLDEVMFLRMLMIHTYVFLFYALSFQLYFFN